MPAALHNRIKLALLRLGEPLRVALPRLRHLDMVLAHDAWVCVDPTLNDIPVVAWVDFSATDRDSLIAPFECEQRFYHAHAEKIIAILFDELSQQIDARLT